MNRCKTCRWWTEWKRYGKPARVCDHPKLGEDTDTMGGDDYLSYPYMEGGVFYPGPEFGCVHHEQVLPPDDDLPPLIATIGKAMMAAGWTPEIASEVLSAVEEGRLPKLDPPPLPPDDLKYKPPQP